MSLDKNDIILNPFPNWTIAYWPFVFFLHNYQCELVNIKMKPFHFWDVVNEINHLL